MMWMHLEYFCAALFVIFQEGYCGAGVVGLKRGRQPSNSTFSLGRCCNSEAAYVREQCIQGDRRTEKDNVYKKMLMVQIL